MLQTILKKEEVHYNLEPVSRYDELQEACSRQITPDDDPVSLTVLSDFVVQ